MGPERGTIRHHLAIMNDRDDESRGIDEADLAEAPIPSQNPR